MQIRLGIDASNIRAGGGLTHLRELLQSAAAGTAGIGRVILWSGQGTLELLPDRKWIERIHHPVFDRSLPFRVFWQQFQLPHELRKTGCDVLFSPGGTLPRRLAIPSVTMSQNLLPFEPREASRFGTLTPMGIKMALLHQGQRRSMERADGLIFLTRYAQTTVLDRLDHRPENLTIIPHGIGEQFFTKSVVRGSHDDYSAWRPFRILYVSIIDVYKHQWQVAQAVAFLRQQGLPVTVDFVGPAYPPALVRLTRVINNLDPSGIFLHYLGAKPFEELPGLYRQADAFVFASSCENLPNILIEAMASGLPIACSNLGPMPEVLGDAGLYFHPERPAEIAAALRQLFEQPQLRLHLAQAALARSKRFSWEQCAKETFSFVAQVFRSYSESRGDAAGR